MNIQPRSLIPIGCFASLGAPILYVGHAIVTNTIAGRGVDIPLLVAMLGAALIFSLIATMGLVVATIGIARLLRIQAVNVPLLTVVYVLGTSTFVAIRYGVEQSLVFAILALANAIIFVVLSKNSKHRMGETKRNPS